MGSDDDEQPMGARVCVDCRTHAPSTDTNYTLISSRYGWRLTRRFEHGQFVVEWRCPKCWDRHKRAKAALTPTEGLPHFGARHDDDDPPSSSPPSSSMPPTPKKKW